MRRSVSLRSARTESQRGPQREQNNHISQIRRAATTMKSPCCDFKARSLAAARNDPLQEVSSITSGLASWALFWREFCFPPCHSRTIKNTYALKILLTCSRGYPSLSRSQEAF